MVLNGHIYRGRKPVHWSPSSRTALAEAELEYPEGHKSKSVYVAFPVATVADGANDELRAALNGAAFAVWTTTPWTMPANMAVAVNADIQYSIVQVRVISMPRLLLEPKSSACATLLHIHLCLSQLHAYGVQVSQCIDTHRSAHVSDT